MDEPQFNNLSSLSAYLRTRRSGRPRNLVAPGPTKSQLEDIVAVAMRTPDHGKLAPWRVVSIMSDQREHLADRFKAAYLAENPNAGQLELEAMKNIACEAPALLVVLFSPVSPSKIPLWEQQLSCGAFCMNILHATHIAGFHGSWITGWPAYSDTIRDLFGTELERIAGFLYIGTNNMELQERPRPDLSNIFTAWDGK